MGEGLPSYAKILGGIDLVVICSVVFTFAATTTKMEMVAADANEMKKAKIPEQLVEVRTNQKFVTEDIKEVRDELKEQRKILERIDKKVSIGENR